MKTKWVTTNIRLPEDMYMKLKLQAARERTSIAALIREKIKPETKSLDGKKQSSKFLKLIGSAKNLYAQEGGGQKYLENEQNSWE